MYILVAILVYLIPPDIPARCCIPCKKLYVRVIFPHQLSDLISCNIRLLGMGTQRCKNELAYAVACPVELTLSSYKARLRVTPGPTPKAEKVTITTAVLFYPLKADASVLKTPCLNYLQCLFELWVSCQRKSTQLSAARSCTGRLHISSIRIVG